MKYLLKFYCFCLFVSFPVVSLADPSGTVIFRHPQNDYNELWITDFTNTQHTRLIYKHSEPIYKLAAQKNGPYITFVTDIPGLDLGDVGYDIFLYDSEKPKEKARNLTQKLFDGSWDVDISNKGNIIFTTIQLHRNGDPPGLYLIPNSELHKKEPVIEMLLEDDVNSIVWSPKGDQIMFHNIDGIFSMDLATRRVSLVQREARYPTFSPDGTKLAFINRPLFDPQDIRIVSLANLEVEQIIEVHDRERLGNLKWTPDGKCLIYKTANNFYAVSINGGDHKVIFQEFETDILDFDWTNSISYNADYTNHLTTIWGKLKQKN